MSASPQFLALVLTDTFLAVAVWQREGEIVSITARSTCLPLADTNETTITTTLEKALNELGEVALDIQPIMLCLPNSWVNADGLLVAKKHYLKQLTLDLKLQPMGFIVTSDAIAAREKEQHQVTLQGCLLYTNPQQLLAEIYQAGQLEKIEVIGRSSNFTTDVHELAARLPSTLNLIACIPQPGEEYTALVDILQQQFPHQLAVMTAEELVTAAIDTGGKVMNLPEKSRRPAVTESRGTAAAGPVASTAPAAEFRVPSFLNSPAAGPAAATATEAVETDPDLHDTMAALLPAAATTARPALFSRWPFNGWLARLRRPPTTTPPIGEPNVELAPAPRRPIKLFIPIVIIVLVGLGLAGGYWQLNRSYTAHITVRLQSTPLEKPVTFLLSTTGAPTSSASMSAVAATAVSVDDTLDKEVPTTGVKIIGDKAQGKVTIYNHTNQTKSFPANTKLALGKLIYTTLEAVSVASASTQFNSTGSSTTFGTTDVKISADKIGIEYNVDKNQQFSIANFDTSSYTASNVDPLSGGSSREIQAVAAKDIDAAASELLAAATSELKDKLLAQANDTTLVFPAASAVSKSKSSSEAVGNEAKFTKVQVTAELAGVTVSSQALADAAPQLLGEAIPAGLHVEVSSVKLENPTVQTTGPNGTWTVSGTLTAKAVGTVDAEKMLQDITRQFVARAQTIIEAAAPTDSVTITIRPTWARWLFPRLPAQVDRINLTISGGQ
jgi:hypothetical protein